MKILPLPASIPFCYLASMGLKVLYASLKWPNFIIYPNRR